MCMCILMRIPVRYVFTSVCEQSTPPGGKTVWKIGFQRKKHPSREEDPLEDRLSEEKTPLQGGRPSGR